MQRVFTRAAAALLLTAVVSCLGGCSCGGTAGDIDAGVDADVDAYCVPDPAADTPPAAHSCDSTGAAWCTRWANIRAGTAWDGVSYCFSMGYPDAGYPSCTRSEGCAFVSGAYQCFCGAAPACDPGFVCARPHGQPTEPLRCVCAPGGGSP